MRNGYYIGKPQVGGTNLLRTQNLFGKVAPIEKIKKAKFFFSFCLFVFSSIAAILSVYALIEVGRMREVQLSERLFFLKELDDSEETLQRVGSILSFLVENNEKKEAILKVLEGGVEGSKVAEESPLTVTTNGKAWVKKEPLEKSETLMVLSKDSKLLVAGSSSRWFEVVTPTGEKGWLLKDEVVRGEAISG